MKRFALTAASLAFSFVAISAQADGDEAGELGHQPELHADGVVVLFHDDDLSGEQRFRVNQLIDERMRESITEGSDEMPPFGGTFNAAQIRDIARATADDGRVFEADAIVAADGIKSVVRAQLSQDEPVGSEYVAYRGALPISQIKHSGDMEAVVVWMGPECHLVQYPLRQGELFNTVAVYRSPSFAAGQLVYEGDAELREAYKDCVPEVRAALDNLSHVQRWPMFDRVPIENWVDGNIALAGDAAHPMLQYLAQGACQALEDAAALEAISARTVFADPENHDASQWNAVFRAYNAVRQPRTARIQTTARVWGESWHLTGPVERTVRNMLWKSADRHGIWDYTDWLYGDQDYAPARTDGERVATGTAG